MSEKILEGEYVYLRKMEIEDTDMIVTWRNSDVQMIICEKENNRAIGSAYIRDIDHTHNKGEYGLFIGEEVARGKGIGREVTHLMLEYGLGELGLHRIYSRVLEDNVISVKSALHGGLEQEGLAIDDVYLNGKYHNVVMLGKVKKM